MSRFDDFDAEFERAQRRIRVWQMIMIPVYLIGIALVLGILAVVLYGLARYVGLI